jgi:catechol 2,3-dioxygenase-like lactoylglutathione lyase family enzyme
VGCGFSICAAARGAASCRAKSAFRETAMSATPRPQLSHCGVYARDLDRMVAFYTETVGLVLSDRGVSSRGGELAFMTAAPGHHHQLVVVSGRAPEGLSTVNQLSFKVPGLGPLKEMHRRARAAGITEIRQTSHGNALSIYFPDPEGNMVEVYMDTPWYVPQPHGVPIDLSLPDDEIMAWNERHCRQTPGFMPLADWQAEVEGRLRRAQ